MRIAQAACAIFVDNQPFAWRADWAWGLPLIVLTVLIHVAGLLAISQRVVHGNVSRTIERHRPKISFVVVLGTTTLLATLLHGLEAGIWAYAYRFLGALPDLKSSVLYSLNAMTSYGHTNLNLEDHWHLLGALEALNGWLLFGLTTAFLFAVIEDVRPLGRRSEHR
jgi:hypothetical protein